MEPKGFLHLLLFFKLKYTLILFPCKCYRYFRRWIHYMVYQLWDVYYFDGKCMRLFQTF